MKKMFDHVNNKIHVAIFIYIYTINPYPAETESD